ncbi:MAG: hypothetical protein JST80_08985 [Bdellovibrionales bacterium]|nr:hypothetical protein [Bdellovibrionales bacterium]
MELAALIALLIGNTFVTDCVQTQDNGHSGFARDSIAFAKVDGAPANSLKVKLERKMYAAQDCTGAETYTSEAPGSVEIGGKVQSFFQSTGGETVLEADWLFESDNGKKELGAIGVSDSTKTVRIARNTPGFSRNTMLNIIGFKGGR